MVPEQEAKLLDYENQPFSTIGAIFLTECTKSGITLEEGLHWIKQAGEYYSQEPPDEEDLA